MAIWISAVSLGTGEVRLYRNDRGVLTSVGAQLGMPQAGSHELRGLSWGDYDADGFIDLLGGSTPTDKLTVVLHNEGGKKFVDVAAAIGLTIPKRSARQTNWVDYDNDGDLDVYSADRSGDNKLFRNDGGTFHARLRRRRTDRPAPDRRRLLARYGRRRRSRSVPGQPIRRGRCDVAQRRHRVHRCRREARA